MLQNDFKALESRTRI